MCICTMYLIVVIFIQPIPPPIQPQSEYNPPVLEKSVWNPIEMPLRRI